MGQFNPSQRLRVFLCHSSDDKPAVRELYQRLTADGVAPWLDEEELLPGQDWEREIRRAVRASQVIIVCLSRGSISKVGFLQKEIRLVLDVADEQPEGTIFVIPLKLEECDVPDRLTRWQWVNFFDGRGYERLMRALQTRANALGMSWTTTVVAPASVAVDQQILDGLLSNNAKLIRSALWRLESLSTEVYIQRLLEVIADYETRPAETRYSIGVVLASLGDPRDFDAMVSVPAGKFQYGEHLRIVEIETPFRIGRYPVTNTQYKKFVDAKAYPVPQDWDQASRTYQAGAANLPVTRVNRKAVLAYCEWVGKRLPTEQEWERTARGTDGRVYPWGDEFDANKANTRESGIGMPSPVGVFSNGMSPCGALDMAGNVFEWATTAKGKFVLRGGSWNTPSHYAVCFYRDTSHPGYRDSAVGFRVAESVL